MPRKPDKIPYPNIDGSMSRACYYYTRNAKINDQTILTKEEMIELFINRFGYPPNEVFYGKPNGSIIYAGPLLDSPSPDEGIATDPGDLQPTLL